MQRLSCRVAPQSAGEDGCASSRRLAARRGRDYGFVRPSLLFHEVSAMNITVESLIGQPVGRAEDPRFLAGTGTFIGDMNRDGMLHAVVLRSGVAHGRIRRVDTAAARAIRGVHAVITATDIGDKIPLIPLRLANL